ncbi:hypothetical protein ACFQ9U_23120 [Streptomyces sp. NPDC056568]|uniref:hypothetical protein n=1 Tax=Streptomyces sp. NPDC056568 TaxID=3345866 RepID=UPI00368F3DB0
MPLDLTTARQELDDARATLATLEEQVRDGADVTPQQLAAQRELISFAELRVEAAQRTETRIREEERAALGAAAKTSAEQLVTGAGMDEIGDAARTAVDALARLAALAYQRNERIAEVGASLVQLDEDLKAAGLADEPWGSRRYGVWGDRGRVAVPGVGAAEQLDVGRLSVAVVTAGLGDSPEGRQAQMRHMMEFNGLRSQMIAGLVKAYPALAPALARQGVTA